MCSKRTHEQPVALAGVRNGYNRMATGMATAGEPGQEPGEYAQDLRRRSRRDSIGESLLYLHRLDLAQLVFQSLLSMP